jgi:hypothetical protein
MIVREEVATDPDLRGEGERTVSPVWRNVWPACGLIVFFAGLTFLVARGNTAVSGEMATEEGGSVPLFGVVSSTPVVVRLVRLLPLRLEPEHDLILLHNDHDFETMAEVVPELSLA